MHQGEHRHETSFDVKQKQIGKTCEPNAPEGRKPRRLCRRMSPHAVEGRVKPSDEILGGERTQAGIPLPDFPEFEFNQAMNP